MGSHDIRIGKCVGQVLVLHDNGIGGGIMECSCVCDYDYDSEPVKLYTDNRPRARKGHVCCECAGAIKVGEIYSRQKYLFDGSWWEAVSYTHLTLPTTPYV